MLLLCLQGSYLDYISVDEEVQQLIEHIDRLVKDNAQECRVRTWWPPIVLLIRYMQSTILDICSTELVRLVQRLLLLVATRRQPDFPGLPARQRISISYALSFKALCWWSSQHAPHGIHKIQLQVWQPEAPPISESRSKYCIDSTEHLQPRAALSQLVLWEQPSSHSWRLKKLWRWKLRTYPPWMSLMEKSKFIGWGNDTHKIVL